MNRQLPVLYNFFIPPSYIINWPPLHFSQLVTAPANEVWCGSHCDDILKTWLCHRSWNLRNVTLMESSPLSPKTQFRTSASLIFSYWMSAILQRQQTQKNAEHPQFGETRFLKHRAEPKCFKPDLLQLGSHYDGISDGPVRHKPVWLSLSVDWSYLTPLTHNYPDTRTSRPPLTVHHNKW